MFMGRRQRGRGRFAVHGMRCVFLDIVKIGRDAWAAVRKTCAVAIRIAQAATVASPREVAERGLYVAFVTALSSGRRFAGAPSGNKHESLILAQNERWRQA